MPRFSRRHLLGGLCALPSSLLLPRVLQAKAVGVMSLELDDHDTPGWQALERISCTAWRHGYATFLKVPCAGAGNWGRLGDEYDVSPAALDKNDPNSDDEEAGDPQGVFQGAIFAAICVIVGLFTFSVALYILFSELSSTYAAQAASGNQYVGRISESFGSATNYLKKKVDSIGSAEDLANLAEEADDDGGKFT